MSIKKPTEAQSRILESINKDILVSASAGTGKTTVMIEKIARLIVEKKVTAEELLVVTFTKLAAGEMKRRLKNKLAQCGADFADQLAEIDGCDISTIHAFCANLVRRYFYILDIDPAFAILDEAEALLERARCMDEVFGQCYETQDEQFLLLAEVFSAGRKDESLKDAIKDFYNFSVCLPDFEVWFGKIRTAYNEENTEKGFFALASETWRGKLHTYKTAAEEIATQAENSGEAKIVNFFAELAQSLDLSEAKTFSQLAEKICGITFNKFNVFNRKKEDYPEMYAKASACFYQCKDEVENIQEFFDGHTTEQIQSQLRQSFSYIDALAALTQRFKTRYDEVKRAKGVLDYNDLEHFALMVLNDENALKQIKEKYKYVFVDEFQDTNELQAEIIEKIKRTDSLFLVGDIKQSIYSFRQCRPQIFSSKLNASGIKSDVVFMNDNFRSNSGILATVNKIFERIMSVAFGALDYKKTSKMKAVKCARTPLMPVYIDFIRFEKKEKCVPTAMYDILKSEGGSEAKHGEAEACVVAKRIKEIVGQRLTSDSGEMRVIRFSDIVILVRNSLEQTQRLIAKLTELQVPVVSEIKQSLFDCEELKSLINLLKVIDNPMQDIPLAAAMTGFFGGFSEQELLEIYCRNEGGFFHERILNALENKNELLASKLQKFFDFTERLRRESQNLTLHQFLSRLLAETDFLLYVSGLPNGRVRRAKAEQFVQSAEDKFYDGDLKLFLEYAERWNDKTSMPAAGLNSDAVRVMTIHQSKGLEFPVVFLCGVNEAFKDDKKSVRIDSSVGIGTYYFDLEQKTKRVTLASFLAKEACRKNQKEEEMRVLYVALTRAENHLYIVGCKNTAKNEKKMQTAEEANSMLDMLVQGLSPELGETVPPAGFCCDLDDCRVTVFDADSLYEQSSAQKTQFHLVAKGDETFTKEVRQRLTATYPHEFATKTELKASASKLSAYEKASGADEDYVSPRVLFPDISVTDLGTAYHKVFEIADFGLRNKEAATEAVRKVRASGLFDKAVTDKLDADLVEKVFKLPLFENLENKKIYRELPFMLKADAGDIYGKDGEGETLFLQGVIDLLIVEKNHAVIVDFKYAHLTAAMREHYSKQLQSYMLAVRAILKCENVDAYLVSIPESREYKI